MKHFVLTRFNLCLWTKDKTGKHILHDTEWLKRRFALFESFCLPSMKAQTCQQFDWILLLDADTPSEYRQRMVACKATMPQMHLVWVQPEAQERFVAVFQQIVANHITADDRYVLTTYLDNDDAVNARFIEQIQDDLKDRTESTFLFYPFGIQYFTTLHLATRITYSNNHFCTLKEPVQRDCTVRTVYGYGSHFLLHKSKSYQLFLNRNVRDMWIEAIHEENVDNDVKMTFHTRLISSSNKLSEEFPFSIPYAEQPVRSFLLRFLPRILRQICRRLKGKFSAL